MNNVDALNGSLHAPQAQGAGRAGARLDPESTTQATPQRETDSVELSSSAIDTNARAAQITRVREEIDAGTYLTDDRLNAAVDALLGKLFN